MRGIARVVAVVAVFSGLALGQVFEVASIKPAPDPPPGGGIRVGVQGGPGSSDPTHATFENFDLFNLLTMAYQVRRDQVSPPAWLRGRTQMFNLSVTIPEGTTKAQYYVMLQNLLIERFRLAVHHESREMPVYELVVAKGGPKLKESGDAPAEVAPLTPAPPKLDKDGYPILNGRGTSMMNGKARMFYPGWTTAQIAGLLSNHVGHPVTDATGLKWKYEFALTWATDNGSQQPSDDAGPTIFNALQEQLGLKLEPKKGQVDFLVVDHLEKMPTEN